MYIDTCAIPANRVQVRRKQFLLKVGGTTPSYVYNIPFARVVADFKFACCTPSSTGKDERAGQLCRSDLFGRNAVLF